LGFSHITSSRKLLGGGSHQNISAEPVKNKNNSSLLWTERKLEISHLFSRPKDWMGPMGSSKNAPSFQTVQRSIHFLPLTLFFTFGPFLATANYIFGTVLSTENK
jgi:hypothetical protein